MNCAATTLAPPPASANGRRDGVVGRRVEVDAGAGAGVGREGDRGSRSSELVLRPVDVGDELDRPAARGIVAVVGRVDVGEHVVAGAAGDRVDGAGRRAIVSLPSLPWSVSRPRAAVRIDVVAQAAEHRVGAAAPASTVSLPSLPKIEVGAAPVGDEVAALAADHRVGAGAGARSCRRRRCRRSTSAPVPVTIESLPSAESLPPTTVAGIRALAASTVSLPSLPKQQAAVPSPHERRSRCRGRRRRCRCRRRR